MRWDVSSVYFVSQSGGVIFHVLDQWELAVVHAVLSFSNKMGSRLEIKSMPILLMQLGIPQKILVNTNFDLFNLRRVN